MANVTYNRIVRKLVVGFGNLFNDITLVRYNPDNTEAERFIVPIAYAPKELYVQRLEGDPTLDKKVQLTLPRLSFEMVGLTYDPTRKQNTNFKSFAQTTGGTVSQYNPVPYNFDFNLYLYVRNIEDGTQVIEHILPYFTPDYTIKLNLVPEMGIVKEIPVVLNSTTHETTYEGPRDSDTRTIIWTLNFTVKGYVFGQISSAGLIHTSITNIYNEITPQDKVIFNMAHTGVGEYQIGEIVYQGYNAKMSTATGKVVDFGNGQLHLTNISGNFVSNQPIVGMVSNSNYQFTSYQIAPMKFAEVIITPNPTDATGNNNNYTYVTSISEMNTAPVITNGINLTPSNYLSTEDLLGEAGLLDLNK